MFNLRRNNKPGNSAVWSSGTSGLPVMRGRHIRSVWQVSHGDHGFLTQLIFFRPHQGTIFLFEASCCGVRRE